MKKTSYVTELDIEQDVHTVREIIEEQLVSEHRVHKYYVIQVIKVCVKPSHLRNCAFAAGKRTKDGMQNIENGAKVVFCHAMQRLKEHYVVHKTGFIKRRRKPSSYDEAVQAYLSSIGAARLMPDQPDKELSELRGTTWFLRNVNGPLARVNHNGEVRSKAIDRNS